MKKLKALGVVGFIYAIGTLVATSWICIIKGPYFFSASDGAWVAFASLHVVIAFASGIAIFADFEES
ncbi:hypothetical protein KGP36_02455 [Patescibacteria group bacterium]|nr:hypothetical protein [Patescibacteria group bacterium]